MNKKDFLKFLEDKLFYLTDNIKTSEIDKYTNVIDSYIGMGQTEEAAVSSLGDPSDLVMAIYLSHGLDYKKLSAGTMSASGIKGAFKNFYMILTGQDKSKMKNAIIYFLYLIFLIIILKIVFIFVRDMGLNVFNEITDSKLANKIYSLVFEVGYIVTAILVFFKSFTKKFK